MKRVSRIYQRILCLVLLLILNSSVESLAHDFFVDRVFYRIIPGSTNVIVTSNDGWGGSYSGRVDIPSSVTYNSITYNVTGIEKYAFYDCMYLSYVSLPNSITDIGMDAFRLSNIDSIAIPSSVLHIESGVFSSCKNLKKATISSAVIGESMFYNCTMLSDVTISSSITSIGSGAFHSCSSLKNINIPNSVTSIGQGAFSGCRELTSISFLENLTYIGQHAFSGCSALTELMLPQTISTIGEGAFQGCSGLDWVIILNASPFRAYSEMFPSDVVIYVPNASRYRTFGTWNEYEWSKYNIRSIYNTSPQITRCNMSSNVPDVFGLNDATLRDANGQLLETITAQNNSLSLEHLEQNTDYNVSVSINFNTFVFIIDDYFSTSPIIVGHLSSLLTNLTSFSTTFNVNRDTGLFLDSCGVESNSGVDSYLGYFKDITDNSFTIECAITGLSPDKAYNLRPWVAYKGNKIYGDIVILRTAPVSFSEFSSSSTTQTTLTPFFIVNRDEDFFPNSYGVENASESYAGTIIASSDENIKIQCIITDLTPNKSYKFRPWVQYNDEKYYGDYRTFNTAPINVNNEITVTPTSVNLICDYSPGDANITNAYITYNGESMNTLYQTGLDPNTTYNYTYTVETTSGSQINNNSFYTPSLSMVSQPVKMLTNTTVMFEAQTNMIDEETMVGFEWRRYDAPNEMPSTQVYSPVFGGRIAGTLRNLAENVYYKYRPFYKSNSGRSYYGNWVAFLTADAGVVYEPMVYTYNSPVVTQTEATLQGVALRGSEEITEQGFEYWKSGTNLLNKITASGERMSKKISGLQSGTKYTFRAFVTSGGQTHYGNEVDFVTLSNNLDVNGDGEVNIADINAVIDMILSDRFDIKGDVNDDGEINITDINAVIDAILSN